MFKTLRNENGNTLVTSLILVVIMGYIGASLVDVTNNDASSSTNELQSIQALQIGNGGLQQALEKVLNGESPDVENKALGAGTFTIDTNPTTQDVTVTAQVGLARKVQNLKTTFAKQATETDVTPAYYTNRELKGIEIIKTANNKAILTEIQVSWNWSVCAQNLTCTPTTGTSSPSSDPASGKVTICHIPPGNPSNAHSISVGVAAEPAHMAHGDTAGACPSTTASDPVVCEGYESEILACGPSGAGPTVNRVIINGTTVASGINATNGSRIDITDVEMAANQAYIVDEIRFSQNLPDEAWYSVTFYFADGSTHTDSFKFSEPTAHGRGP